MSINNFENYGPGGLTSIIGEAKPSDITHGRGVEDVKPFPDHSEAGKKLNEFALKFDTWLGNDTVVPNVLGATFPISNYEEAYGYGGMSVRSVPEESKNFTLTVGRTAGNNVMLNRGAISETHAKFVTDVNGDFMVGDLGSTNGTLVNGEMLVPRVGKHLQSGDIVQIGQGPDAAVFIVLDFKDSGGGGVRRRAVARLPMLDKERGGLGNVIKNIQALRNDPSRSDEFYKAQARVLATANMYEQALRLSRR